MNRSRAIHHVKRVITHRERYAESRRLDPGFYAQTDALRFALAALERTPHGWRPPGEFNAAEFDAVHAEGGG